MRFVLTLCGGCRHVNGISTTLRKFDGQGAGINKQAGTRKIQFEELHLNAAHFIFQFITPTPQVAAFAIASLVAPLS
jgi:hypothetical protein